MMLGSTRAGKSFRLLIHDLDEVFMMASDRSELLWPIVLLVLLSFSFKPAFADTAGEPGEILSIEILESTSDNFVTWHGDVVIRQLSDGRDQQYRWGGAACPGRDLEDARVNYLFELSTTPYMVVTIYWKQGAGGNRCVVGFVASNRKFL
jgi:hypothetical protein